MGSTGPAGFRGTYCARLRTGEPLGCLVCGSARFAQRAIKLNTTGASLFGLDWANADSLGLACTTCGYLHEFAHGYVALEESPAS